MSERRRSTSPASRAGDSLGAQAADMLPSVFKLRLYLLICQEQPPIPLYKSL